MPSTRKVVRETLLAVLADPDTGFNANLANVGAAYGIDSIFEIDWTTGSPNFFQGNIAPDQIVSADLIPDEAGVCVALYTSVSQTNSGDERQKPSIFSGKILLHVDFYLRRRKLHILRQGDSLPPDVTGDMEILPDAIEDAFLTTVMAPDVDWFPVSFNGDFQCSREPFLFMGDGWQARIPFQLMCEVHV